MMRTDDLLKVTCDGLLRDHRVKGYDQMTNELTEMVVGVCPHQTRDPVPTTIADQVAMRLRWT